jgi:hypothetical protein
MWNRNNGIVFAGVGISTEAGKPGIPNIIEEGIAGPNPLASASNQRAASPEFIGRGAYPDIAADAKGGLHVVYVRDGTLRYRYRPPGSANWSEEENTGLPQGMANRSDPEIAVAADGSLYALVGSTVARREDGKWQPLEATFVRDTDLALDSRGAAYVVRRGGNEKGFLGLLKCEPNSDRFESLPDPDVAVGFPAGRNDHVYGSIAISPMDDSIHIVYRHGTPRNIAYRVSADGGKTWQGGGITDREPEAPAIAVTPDGQVFVANADGHVFRRGDSPDEWVDLGQAFEGGRRDLPQIAMDQTGAVHVVAFGGRYNRLADGQWDGVRTLPSRNNQPLGYADFALAPDGTLWVVYEEGNEVRREESSGESDILLLPISPAN